jgi:hypothetical protein
MARERLVPNKSKLQVVLVACGLSQFSSHYISTVIT